MERVYGHVFYRNVIILLVTILDELTADRKPFFSLSVGHRKFKKTFHFCPRGYTVYYQNKINLGGNFIQH